MKSLFLLLFILSLPLSNQLRVTESFDDAKAPFIQYYSPTLRGMVIERADGTDTRIIGQGDVASESQIIVGPGWSPRGDWFAWYSTDVGIRTAKAHIFKADNSRRVTVLDGMTDINQMAWVGNKNWLLAANLINPGHHHSESTDFFVIDAAQDRVIQSFSLLELQHFTPSPVSDHILVSDETRAIILYPDASIFTIGLTRREVRWHVDGRLLIYGEDGLMIFDPVSKRTQNYDIGDFHVQRADIDANHLIGDTDSDNHQQHFVHLDLTTGDLEPLYNTPLSGYRWIYPSPDGKQALYMTNPESKKVLQLYDFETHHRAFVTENATFAAWSPSGDKALYWTSTDNQNYQIWLYDVASGDSRWLMDTDTETRDYVPELTQFFSPNEQTLVIGSRHVINVFDADGNLLQKHTLNPPFEGKPEIFNLWQTNSVLFIKMTVREYRYETFKVDLTTASVERQEQPTDLLGFSPDNKSIVYSGVCGPTAQLQDIDFCMDDITIPAHSSIQRMRAAYANWHPSSNWVMLGQISNYAGPPSMWHIVSNREGTVVRDINEGCSNYDVDPLHPEFQASYVCVDWVPERIDVERVTGPPLENTVHPQTTLYHPGRVGLVKWNLDNTLLATSFRDENGSHIWIWDLATQTVKYSLDVPDMQLASSITWLDEERIALTVQQSLNDEPSVIIWTISEDTLTENAFTFPHGPYPLSGDLIVRTSLIVSRFDIGLRFWFFNTTDYTANGDRISPLAAVSSDGKSLLYINPDDDVLTRRQIDTWQDESVVKLAQFQMGQYDELNQLAISDDEHLVAISGSGTNQINVWQDGDLIVQYYGSAWNLDFNAAGTQLAAAVSHRVHLYEVVPQPNFIQIYSHIPAHE